MINVETISVPNLNASYIEENNRLYLVPVETQNVFILKSLDQESRTKDVVLKESKESYNMIYTLKDCSYEDINDNVTITCGFWSIEYKDKL